MKEKIQADANTKAQANTQEQVDPVFEMESEHLEITLGRLRQAIHAMESGMASIEASRREQNRYLKDEMGAAPGDFLQAVEFSQTLQAEKQLLEQRGYQDQQAERYVRLLPKPYFARIDYSEHGQKEPEPVYIGYGNFMDSKTLDIYIYDWRTPIASVFYDFQTGPVHYMAPDGRIQGHVHLKRQFDIQKSKLIAYYDTKEHIADERLLEALADRTAGPMHQIVETLQAAQNRIIREKRATALFVDGVAGSGKTIVALHRIAYLLYHGLKNSLKSQQILVLSPNDLFSDYIGHVIPELGEEQVQTLTLGEVLSGVMGKDLKYQSPYNRLEAQLLGRGTALEALAQRMKADPRILRAMSETMVLFEKKGIASKDFYYGEERLTTKAAMRKAIVGDGRPRPLMKRVERFLQRVRHKVKDVERKHYAELLLETMLSGEHPFDYKAVARLKRYKRYLALSKTLDEAMAVDGLSVYRFMLEQPQLLAQHFEELTAKEVKAICQETLKAMAEGYLGLEDWVIAAGFQMALFGEHPLSQLRQVVVDESQDYTPVLYGVFKALFPKAHFTILGDARQRMTDVLVPDHHQHAAQVMGVSEPVFATLNVAYRNVAGIGQFCRQLFEGAQDFEIVPRQGDAPRVYEGPDSLLGALTWLESKGHQTLAILTKTMTRATEITEGLKALGLSPVLIDDSATRVPTGLLVMPVYYAKGMEFDGVLVADVDQDHYVDLRDRQLLYVAASRALHHLAFAASEKADSPWLTAAGLEVYNGHNLRKR